MNGELRILFLASWYPHRGDFSLGNFVQRHAEAIGTKHRVWVVSATASDRPTIERKKRGSIYEITVYYRNEIPFISYVWSMMKGIRLAKKQAKSFDLCHVNVAWPAGFLALFSRTPFIVTEHFSGYLKERNYQWSYLRKKITTWVLNKAQVVVPVSEYLKQAMSEFAPKAKFTVVPNVVNEKVFFYRAPRYQEFFTLLHISSLEEESKNIIGLLQTIRLLVKRRRYDFKILIGGDGDMHNLEKLILRHEIPFDQLEVFGEQTAQGAADLMNESHALLMFSKYETQSCTVLESLCSGRPILSSAVGGIPEIVDESNSILVESGNVKALANAVEEMIDNYDNYDLEKMAQEARAKYCYDSIADSYTKVYASVLKKDS